MPSMSTSHGGVLYYVVKVPRRQCSPDRTASNLFLDENAITSTPIPNSYLNAKLDETGNPGPVLGKICQKTVRTLFLVNNVSVRALAGRLQETVPGNNLSGA
ncbi:hypothetical protein V9T40_002596 [Parthenolecanium corni]|uniref:Uncharacterized protein n=1 Tax=Parthenolecanium corni TaxID=536013 RepID=A0AAN9TGH4_9HEMI